MIPRKADQYLYGPYDGITVVSAARMYLWHGQHVLASDHYRPMDGFTPRGRVYWWVWFKTTYTPYFVEAA